MKYFIILTGWCIIIMYREIIILWVISEPHSTLWLICFDYFIEEIFYVISLVYNYNL